MKYIQIVLIALTIVLMNACVSAKKYREVERQATAAQQNYDECKVDANLLKKRIKQLQADIQKLQAEKASLEQDTTLYGMKNRTLLNQLAILENDLRLLAARLGNTPEYKALMEHLMQMQDELLDSEDKRLDTQRAIEEQKKALDLSQQALEDSKLMLQNSRQALEGKEAELSAKDQELSAAHKSIEEQAQRLRELEAALNAKENEMAELRNAIANALVDFSSDDIKVEHRNGKVYVMLEEKLLFASGKYDVNSQGAVALKKIANVLATKDNLNIVVEGHTDNVPYHGQVLIDNWDLSVKRATSVLRIMLNAAPIDPSTIQAAGCADSNPIDNANTAEARRKNRRTEIVLTPNIDHIIGQLKK